jgi:hypothetical protein
MRPFQNGWHTPSAAALGVPAAGGLTPQWKWSNTAADTSSPVTLNTSGSGAWPAGTTSFPISAGDLLIGVALDETDNGTLTLSGWTQFIDTAPSIRIGAWWKIAGAGESGTYTIGNWSVASTRKAATLICFKAGTFNATTPIYGLTGPNHEGFDKHIVLDSVTLTAAQDLFAGLIIGDSSDNTGGHPIPTGFTEVVNDPASYGSASSGRFFGYLVTKVFGEAGPTGTTDVTTTTTIFGIERRSFSFAIKGT